MSLQHELDKAIEQEDYLSQTGEEREGVLDVSDSLKCHRMRWLKYYGYPGKPFDGRSLRTFLMGRVFEKIVVNYWRFTGIVKKKGQYLKHYLDSRIRGKTDATLLKDGKVYVAELKSYDGFGFYRRSKEPEAISLLHEAQCLNYVDILRNQGAEIEDKGLIVEGSRDNLKIMEEYTRPIDQVREELHLDWETVLEAIDSKQIPDVLPDFPSGKSCTYCSRKPICKELNAKEKNKDKTKKTIKARKQKKSSDTKNTDNPE